jgi:hypothetical protein
VTSACIRSVAIFFVSDHGTARKQEQGWTQIMVNIASDTVFCTLQLFCPLVDSVVHGGGVIGNCTDFQVGYHLEERLAGL